MPFSHCIAFLNIDFLMIKINQAKNFFFLNWAIFLLPVSMIIGNAAININCLLISLLFLANIFKKKISLVNINKINIIFFLFFSFFLLNIYLSVNQKISFFSFLGIIRYVFLLAAILYCCKYIESFIDLFSKIILIILILVCLDTLLQFFTGVDIFGYELLAAHGVRLSGPFGDEYIVGSFISKFALISLFYLNKKKRTYEYLWILIVISIVILSNERAASIMCLASLIVYFILTPRYNIKKKFLCFSGIIVFIMSLFTINTQLKEHFIKRTSQQFGFSSGNTDYERESFLDSKWGAHFLTAIKINKNYPFIGSGLHTYRIECRETKYEKIKSIQYKERCNTHPHNIYLEVYSELGTIFFICFILLHIYFTFKLFKIYFFNQDYKNEASIIISLYFMLFFPIQTTGALFSTWNGVIYWVAIALCLNLFTKVAKN